MVGRTSAPPPKKRPAARAAAPSSAPPARVRVAVAAWAAALGLLALVLLLARGSDDAPVPPGEPVPVAPRGYDDRYYESENLRFKRPVAPAAPVEKEEDAADTEEDSP